MRGLWVNTCTASQPISSPRSIAVQMPPEDETWAPNSMAPTLPGSVSAAGDVGRGCRDGSRRTLARPGARLPAAVQRHRDHHGRRPPGGHRARVRGARHRLRHRPRHRLRGAPGRRGARARRRRRPLRPAAAQPRDRRRLDSCRASAQAATAALVLTRRRARSSADRRPAGRFYGVGAGSSSRPRSGSCRRPSAPAPAAGKRAPGNEPQPDRHPGRRSAVARRARQSAGSPRRSALVASAPLLLYRIGSAPRGGLTEQQQGFFHELARGLAASSPCAHLARGRSGHSCSAIGELRVGLCGGHHASGSVTWRERHGAWARARSRRRGATILARPVAIGRDRRQPDRACGSRASARRSLPRCTLWAIPLWRARCSSSSVAPSVWLLSLASFCAGIGPRVHLTLWFTVFQREIPEQTQSRVSSYDALGSFVLMPVGYGARRPALGCDRRSPRRCGSGVGVIFRPGDR